MTRRKYKKPDPLLSWRYRGWYDRKAAAKYAKQTQVFTSRPCKADDDDIQDAISAMVNKDADGLKK